MKRRGGKHRPLFKKVWDAIPWDEPEDARDISARAEIDPGRTCEVVRAAVRWMRRRGLPIVSDGHGFMKTTRAVELVKCARMLFGKADAVRVTGEQLLDRVEEGYPVATYEEAALMLFDEEAFDDLYPEDPDEKEEGDDGEA